MAYQQKDVTEALCAEFVDDLDLTKCFVYLFDIVHEDAIPLLAIQLGVDGYKGMDLANAVEQKREVLKNAYELKRYRGTVYAIETALLNIGFENVQVREGVESFLSHSHNGIYKRDGTIRRGGKNWAVFIVNIYVENPSLISDYIKDSVRKLILYSKNARSVLKEVNFVNINAHFRNGTYFRNGTINHNG
jgi:P2-related tail formation protein